MQSWSYALTTNHDVVPEAPSNIAQEKIQAIPVMCRLNIWSPSLHMYLPGPSHQKNIYKSMLSLL